MNLLQPAEAPDEEIEIIIWDLLKKWEAGDAIGLAFVGPEIKRRGDAIDKIRTMVKKEFDGCQIFRNDQYQVAVRKFDTTNSVHLSIKRIDRQPIHDWRDLQEIKSQLVGAECEAVELYPAESRVVDTSNQYHLWCCSDPAFRFPFGFDVARIVTDDTVGNSKQRPREKV